MKRDHEYKLKEQKNWHETERQQLKLEYETWISNIRDEYQRTWEELKAILEARERSIENTNNELSNLKLHYADEMESLKREVISLQESIKSSKGLHEQ